MSDSAQRLPPEFALLVWPVLLIALVATLVLAFLAQRRRSTPLAIATAACAALALSTAALPLPAAPPAAVGAAVALLGIAVATLAGAPVVETVFRLATASTREGAHGGILVRAGAPDDPTALPSAAREVLRGGLWIGYLERLAVVGTILVAHPEGLAVLIALKGIGRFSELEASEARERFIIGTLASLIWACTIAITVRLAA